MAWLLTIRKIYLQCLIVLVLLILIFTFAQKKYLYKTKTVIEDFNFKRFNWSYRDILLTYYNEKSEFPDNLDELFAHFEYWNFENAFIDLFSKDSSALGYIPIIENNINEGFVLLSCGPDSYLDNRITSITLNKIELLNLYNRDFYDLQNNVIPDTIFKTNVFDVWFGRKDYGVLSFYGPNYIKNQIDTAYSISDFIHTILLNNISRNGKTMRKYFMVELDDFDTKSTDGDLNLIEVKESEYRIKFFIPKDRCRKITSDEKNTISLVGLLTKIDTVDSIIELSNCLVISEYQCN